MTQVIRSLDCGNSPKNQLIENLAIALALGDQVTAMNLVTDDIEWCLVGAETLHGREALRQKLEQISMAPIVKIAIDHAITHGKVGAVNGQQHYHEWTKEFCDVFEFSNARGKQVSRITSYQITTSNKPTK